MSFLKKIKIKNKDVQSRFAEENYLLVSINPCVCVHKIKVLPSAYNSSWQKAVPRLTYAFTRAFSLSGTGGVSNSSAFTNENSKNI